MQPQSVSQSVSQELRVALWLLHVRRRLDQIPGTYQHNAKSPNEFAKHFNAFILSLFV